MSDFSELLDEVLREDANAPVSGGMERGILAHLPYATSPRPGIFLIGTAAAVLLATFVANSLPPNHPAPPLTSMAAYTASASSPAFTQPASEASRGPAIKEAAHYPRASRALIREPASWKPAIHIDPIAIQPVEIEPISVRRVQLASLTTNKVAPKGVRAQVVDATPSDRNDFFSRWC